MEVNKENNKTNLLLEDLLILEDYIHDLFNFSPLPICFISPIGVILEANPAFEQISGFKTEEIIGEPAEGLFEKQEFKELVGETIREEAVEAQEIVLFCQDKGKKIVQVFTRARKDEKGETVGFFLGLFDLTEIKKAEIGLKDAQAALLNILEDTEEARQRAEEEKNKTLAIITNFSDGLLVFDKNHRLVLVNPRAEAFFNFQGGKIIGQPIQLLLKEKSLAPLAVLLGEEIKEFFRKELVLSDDLILEVSSIGMHKDQEDLGDLVVLHDVTRDKIVERLKTEFVSISAHQLRTPLSAIKWTLRMLLDGDLGEISGEQRDFLEKTYNSNERMITLVNSLLNVTRIEEGRFVYKLAPVSLGQITKEVVDNFKDELRRKEITLEFKKPSTTFPRVFVDVEKMKLAIQNLIENAIKYTLAKGKIFINLKKEDKEILFEIRDTGVGIPQKQQERVFQKFFRGANVIRLETEGTGLGLFIVKNVIEAHGGRIWFESEEGKGASFFFTIPIEEKFEGFVKSF